MRGRLSRQMLLASVALAIIVAITFGAMLVAIDGMRGADRDADHSERVVALTMHLRADMLALESGTRGFALTGSPKFLHQWRQAGKRLRRHERKLHELLDRSRSDKQVDRVVGEIDAYVERHVSSVVTLAERDRNRASRTIARESGRRDRNRVQRNLTELARVERAHANEQRDTARMRANIAIGIGIGGLVGSALLLVLFAGMLRIIIRPVRRVAAAARTVAHGELAARVEPGGHGEALDLTQSFNTMASALEQRDEALAAQRSQLVDALGRLAQEKEWVESYQRFGERIAAELEVEPVADILLEGMTELVGCERGALFVGESDGDQPAGLALAAMRGTNPAALPPAWSDPSGGPVAHVARERRMLQERDDAGDELYLPLLYAERLLGVISLAHDDGGAFDAQAIEAAIRLAQPASVALSNAIALRSEREAERMKDEFFALVSHELRTPLTSVTGYLDLTLEEDGAGLPAQQREFVEIAHRNASRLLRLVDDLLFAAQVQAGTFSLQQTTIDLEQVASEAVDAARPRAIERGIALRADLEPAPPLNGDHDRLAQVIDNLISNAIKFTAPGGQITVRLRARADGLALTVADSGVGIARSDQRNLFRRFYRGSGATLSAAPGAGLGLAIAEAIVEAHGGTIEIESEEGVGTTAQIVLAPQSRIEAQTGAGSRTAPGESGGR